MKKFKYRLGEGKYYFNIVSGMQTILVSRREKTAAIGAFQKYLSVGKTCEWLGKWNGKDFIDTSLPVSAAKS
ncbi:MAG: hypothetical protein KDC28_15020 [Saprospiraceae bacterium]|nr:hypothetical protein [Saprospiraceae bacterium]MCB9318055.1 hypothetical protein [Lewinellaceae bacterium]